MTHHFSHHFSFHSDLNLEKDLDSDDQCDDDSEDDLKEDDYYWSEGDDYWKPNPKTNGNSYKLPCIFTLFENYAQVF